MPPKGEFENRDRDELGLGDLPRDLGRERGEYKPSDDQYSRLPADMRSAGNIRKSATLTPFGAPELDFSVRSVYDSRPVNGLDFNQSFTAVESDGSCASLPMSDKLTQCIVVPAGYMAVLRRLDFYLPSLGGVFAIGTRGYDVAVNIYRNGAVVSPMAVLPSPTGSTTAPGILLKLPGSIDTFIVYDEGDAIGCKLASYLASTTFEYSVNFYGQFLVKTGRPAAFEIANAGGRKVPANVATKDEIEAAQSAGLEGNTPRARRKNPRERTAAIPRLKMDR